MITKNTSEDFKQGIEAGRSQAQTEILEIIKKWGKHNDGSEDLIEMITGSKHKGSKR